MKRKPFTLSVLASVCCVVLAVPLAHAQTAAGVQELSIERVELAGQTNLLSAEAKAQVLAVLREGGARRLSEQGLGALLQKAQQVLDAKLPQRFVLSIPAQQLQEQTLNVLVQPRLVGLKVQGSEAFDEANVRASLPSLQEGRALGQSWVDLRELQMANDNPLKLTTVDFDVQPDQGVRANVKASSPYGSTQWTVGLSNTGSDITGRGQVQLNALNGNLTGRDDVLSLASGASLNPFADTGFVALRYSLPDYERHVSHGLELTHSKGDTNTPYFSLKLDNQARYNDVGYRQTHYLGDVAEQLNAVKLTLGATYMASQANSKLMTLLVQENEIKTLPLTLGWESDFKVQPQNQARLRLEWVGSNAKWLGSEEAQNWQAARSGANANYSLVRLGLSGRLDLNGKASLSWNYRGQHSAQKLVPLMQFSAANAFNGVRGFVNTAAMGDSGQVLRLELESAKLTDEADVRGYGFYDVGAKRGGADERSDKLSSYGLGVRAKSADSRVKLDAFVAAKGQGRELDLVSNATTPKSRTSAWVLASYSF
jgi:hemolysin activation/secretion protein